MEPTLISRYLFQGTIQFQSALHIGGGMADTPVTDSPVVRTPDGLPYIPGSSLKGVFRSTVEKFVEHIPKLRTCFLSDGKDCFHDKLMEKVSISKITRQSLKHLKAADMPDAFLQQLKHIKDQEIRGKNALLKLLQETIGARQTEEYESLLLKHIEKTEITLYEYLKNKAEQEVRDAPFKLTEDTLKDLKKEEIPEDICGKLEPLKDQGYANQEAFIGVVKELIGDDQTQQYKLKILRHAAQSREDILVKKVLPKICDTCQLFGNGFTASKIFFSDLYLIPDGWAGVTQVRDGVVIDRDSEKAVHGLKYDFEVVPVGAQFSFEIRLDNPKKRQEDDVEVDLGLTCLGLNEFVSGLGHLGGNRSRGLGNCEMSLERVYEVDFTNLEQLQQYLMNTESEKKMTVRKETTEIEEFLRNSINALFT